MDDHHFSYITTKLTKKGKTISPKHAAKLE
jgi:hypothetical protein